MTTQRPGRTGGHLIDRRALTDPTRCPACAAPLPGSVCSACWLDTSGPTGAELWEASQEVVSVLERRDALIDRIRATTPPTVRQSVVPASPAPPTASLPAAAPSGPIIARPGPAGPPTSPLPAAPSSARPAPPPGPPLPARRSWPLQNVLLALGAVLIGGSSIVFLAFAWGVMPVAVRALIIVGLTALFFALSSLSARRQLTASAEALAAVGSLLVVLDAWALRATGLLDLPSGSWYLAVVAAASAAVLLPLGRRLHVVVPGAIGTLLVPSAPALLALSLPSPGARGPLLALAVAVCAIALHERCEQRVVPVLRGGAIALVALCAVAALGALIDDDPLASAGSSAAAAAACFVWSWWSRDRRAPAPGGAVGAGEPGSAWAAAGGTGVVLAAAAVAAGLVRAVAGREDALSPHVLWAVPLGAALGAFAVGRAVARLPRLGASAPGASVMTLVVIAGLPALMAVALLSAAAIIPSGPDDPSTLVVSAAVVGLLVTAAVLVLVHRSQPGRAPAVQVAALSGALAVLTAGVLPGSPVGRAVLWLAVPLVIVLVIGRRARGPWRTAARGATCAGVGLSAVLGAAMASGGTRGVATSSGELVLAAALVCAAVVLVLAHGWVVSAPDAVARGRIRTPLLLRSTCLVGAVVLGATGLGTAVQAVVDVRSIGWFVAALVSVLPVAALAVARRRTVAEHADLLLAGALTATPALVVGSLEPLVVGTRAGTPGWLVAMATTVAAAALLITCVVGAGRYVPTRFRTVGAALVPVLVVLLVLALQPLDRTGRTDWALLCASIVALLPAFASFLPRPPEAPRRAMELSAAAIGVVALLLLAATDTWQPLLVALLVQAAGALAWALTPGRRSIGWLALALAVAASWVALADVQIHHPEAYTAPGAAAVLLVGLWRLRRDRGAAAAPLLGGVGALLLPTSLLAPVTGSWRPLALTVAVLVVGVVVALTGRVRAGATGLTATPEPAGPRTAEDDPPLAGGLAALALGAGTIGIGGHAFALALAGTDLLRATGGRVIRDTSPSTGAGPDVLVWTGVATFVVAALCVVLGRAWAWQPLRGPRVWAPTLVAAVLTAPLTLLVAGDAGEGAAALAVALVVVWGAAAVLGTPPGLPRIGSRTEFLRRAAPPLVGASITAAVLGTTAVPADVLLLLAGTFVAYSTARFTQVERHTRSWQSVVYGVLATVLPLTVAMLADPTGWRIALGLVVASGWVLAGVRLGWQAPVALGGAALAVQVLALAGPPALAALAGIPGWLVLAVVGGALLLLGLTYERQIQTARASARWYSELR